MSTGSSQTGRMQQTGSPGAPAATALPLQSHGSADLMELEALLAHRDGLRKKPIKPVTSGLH